MSVVKTLIFVFSKKYAIAHFSGIGKLLVNPDLGVAAIGGSVTRLGKILPLGYFLHEHFYTNKKFKTWFVVLILKQ